VVVEVDMPNQVKTTKTPKPVVHPRVDPEFLELVRTIYRRYSAQEFADCVAEIRREIESGVFDSTRD
jgi:hypothetical protein